MPASLSEYLARLEERKLLWPAPPAPVVVKATPAVHPLKGIRAVVWDLYGTLLTIADGQLLQVHPQALRMQVALEKTIHEFNMWQSMTRRPGQPWEYFLPKFQDELQTLRLTTPAKKGDVVEVSTAAVWRKLIGLLEHKKYSYDEAFYGDLDEFAEKVACFYHLCLQGCGAAPQAAEALRGVHAAGLRQGLLADAQAFSVPQLLRALEKQAPLPPLAELFAPGGLILSCQSGAKKPSPSLYQRAVQEFGRQGIEPAAVLYIGARLKDDLAVAKAYGFRTALYAGDKTSLAATGAELQDPALRPDRLLTELGQVRRIVGA